MGVALTGSATSHPPAPALEIRSVEPIVDVLFRFILGIAISRLEQPFQLLTIAIDFGEVVVGQVAPLFFDLPGQLLPVTLNTIPVHRLSSSAVANFHSQVAIW